MGPARESWAIARIYRQQAALTSDHKRSEELLEIASFYEDAAAREEPPRLEPELAVAQH